MILRQSINGAQQTGVGPQMVSDPMLVGPLFETAPPEIPKECKPEVPSLGIWGFLLAHRVGKIVLRSDQFLLTTISECLRYDHCCFD